MTFQLEGKTAIVTGASRGIGREIALSLAKAGAFVYLNCNSNTSLAEVVSKEIAELIANGEAPKTSGSKVVPFSVADSAAVDAAMKEILAESKQIDILVNNAGIARDALLMRMSESDWDDVMGTNLKGVFLCTKALCRTMMKAKSGSIINISSVVGEMGNAGQSAYSASKAGIIGFTKSCAKELAARGVRVNAVTPGFIETEMTNDLPETAITQMLANIPMAKIGAPHSVADSVVWLASEQSSYVTGQVIRVNGGMYM